MMYLTEDEQDPQDMPVITAAALTALKGLLSKAVLFAAGQDSKWWVSKFQSLTSTEQSRYAGRLREVMTYYKLPSMDLQKAQFIMQNAPQQIATTQAKAAAGDAPAVQASYAKAFEAVLQQAISFVEANVPAAAAGTESSKKWYYNPLILAGGALTLYLILKRK